MKKEISFLAQPPAIGNVVQVCAFCGEQAGKGARFCSTCKTKTGRESVLEANKKILKDLRAKGYCLGTVMLPVA